MKNFCGKSLILLFVSMFFSASVFAQNGERKNSPEGVWNAAFSSENFRFPALVEFARKDSKFVGYVTTPQAIEINFSAVVFQQNAFKISGNAVYNGTNIPISLTGEISGGSLTGKMNVPFVGAITMKGSRAPEEFSIVSRVKIFDDVCGFVEKKFYSPNFNGLDWNSEKTNYRRKVAASESYFEMTVLIREMLGKLNASHVAFFPILPNADDASETARTKNVAEKNVEWRKLSEKTGYIKIKSFEDETNQSPALINQAFNELNNLPALVIDLRDNPGGGIAVGLPLAAHLFAGRQCVGYFYNRTGSARLKTDSLAELKRQNFPVFADAILPGKSTGSKLVINGLGNKAYRGKVAILINEADASTTEAFAAAFKESGRGILIGKKTAGAMLGKDGFQIGKFWILELPVTDFRTCGGVNVEGNGVEPDIEVEENEAEDAALIKAVNLLEQ